MPNSDDDDEIPAEVDPAYFAIFTEDLEDFRAHLSGQEHGDSLPASFFAPRTCWSVTEKSAFFRGLTIHSRLRPDLIAEEVKTKTVPDVCVYIAMLEQAEREQAKQLHAGEDGHKVFRNELPVALEVSDKWLDYEERMADAFIAHQPTLDQEAVLREREEEVRLQRNTIRARKGTGNGRDRDAEKDRREEFDKWLGQKTLIWKEEDETPLRSLDHASLTTLDRMLREHEEGRGQARGYCSEGEGGREMIEFKQPVEQHGDGAPVFGIDEVLIDPVLLEISRPSANSLEPQVSFAGSQAAPSTSAPSVFYKPSFAPRTPPFPPALLPSLPIQLPIVSSSGAGAPPARTDEGSLADEDPSQMSPASRRRYQKRLHMRRKRAQAAGTIVNENPERLKPGRKPKKRPPKAQTTGNEATDQTRDVATESETPAQSSSVGVSRPDTDNDPRAYRHPKRSGMTLPYKRQQQFVSQGVDAERLRRQGLGLFHLQAVSKLMQTYNGIHDVSPSIGSEIAGDTLKVLNRLVVNFVAEVMSRAIVCREQERTAKLQTKVWRLRDNQVISAAIIKHALSLYGADSLDKRAHFANLLDRLDLDEGKSDDEDREKQAEDGVGSEADDADDENEVEDEDKDEDEEAEATALPTLSLLRTIFPPFFNPPSSDVCAQDAAASPDPSVYMPRPSSSLLSAAEPPQDEDEDILPDEIDEIELIRELVEDALLDAHDRVCDAELEEALWARATGTGIEAAANSASADGPGDHAEPEGSRVGGRPPLKRKHETGTDGGSTEDRDAEDAVQATDADADGHRARRRKAMTTGSRRTRKQWGLMYREPDPYSRVKSKAYISDSDEFLE